MNQASAENDYHDNCRAQWEVQQSPIVPGGEGQILGTKDALNIGPLDTHLNNVFINLVRYT